VKHDYEEPPRIGHREDALALLEEMIAHCEESKDGYFWPRLEALRDAIARWVI
jgi:hypothetical protein